MKTINQLCDGDRIYGQYLVAECNKCASGKGKPYLNMVFQDATGTVPAKLWDVGEYDTQTYAAGNIVEVEAEALLYQGAMQIKVLSGKKLTNDPALIDASRFVPSAPIPKETLIAKLDSYIDSIQNGEVKTVVAYLIEKHRAKIIEWPAAVRNHHNYASGLLHHTLTMADTAEAICGIYPQLNRDVLIGGILIHDIGKTMELSGPIATQFTLEGKLLGHISIMQGEVREACHAVGVTGEMATIMEHMVLSHHGKTEYGSPVMPLIREALVCSMIDDLDAKMQILDKAYAAVQPGESTARLNNMDERYFYRPTYDKE